ncbi:hypothetical protein B0J15DRAFT_111319 [Fusarium solani]|uniref:Uncharacterized protein n=1 Tax=Fusarium solani TaxID=169388 RepID=A0A9P9RDA4_FUSSL|nr:uncharacterized protein B0J15DRAFT_111319 [Fusarium solani]KAH7273850.1 hypothetical protein B0J15DRAFT_111319 [Fusarium solani]
MAGIMPWAWYLVTRISADLMKKRPRACILLLLLSPPPGSEMNEGLLNFHYLLPAAITLRYASAEERVRVRASNQDGGNVTKVVLSRYELPMGEVSLTETLVASSAIGHLTSTSRSWRERSGRARRSAV